VTGEMPETPSSLLAQDSYLEPIAVPSSTMRIEITSTHLLEQKTLTSIIAVKSQYWPHPIDSQLNWFKQNAGATDSHVLGWKNDSLVGYLRLVPAKGMQEHRTVPLTIVDTVCVDARYQRQSLGLGLMSRGNDAIHLAGRVGLLACDPSFFPFYKRCDWALFSFPVQRSKELRALLPEGSAILIYDPALRLSRLPLEVLAVEIGLGYSTE
jgi:hypothetical protein